MTIEQHLREVIGDYVIRLARLAAENDALREQLAAKQSEAGEPEAKP